MSVLNLHSLKIKVIGFIFFAGVILFSGTSAAQSGKADGKYATYSGRIKSFKKFRYITIGGSLHFLKYFGDLSASETVFNANLNMVRPGIGVWAGYRYSPGVEFRAELLYGRLMGEDFSTFSLDDSRTSDLYIRNLSFRNDIVEFSLTANFYIFRNYREFLRRKFFNIYLLTGVTVLYHNPKSRVPEFTVDGRRFSNYGDWVALRPLGTEGQYSDHYDVKPYSKIQPAWPIGGGFEFKLSERMNICIEFAYRFLVTDYLDDVSGKYVDLGALDGDLAKAMSDRSKEYYSTFKELPRDLPKIIEDRQLYTYTSRYDGKPYTVLNGYGNQGATRGGSNYDMFFTANFKITYILATPFAHGTIK